MPGLTEPGARALLAEVVPDLLFCSVQPSVGSPLGCERRSSSAAFGGAQRGSLGRLGQGSSGHGSPPMRSAASRVGGVGVAARRGHLGVRLPFRVNLIAPVRSMGIE
jgi:hypothetical protein